MPTERQLARLALGDVPRHPGFGPPPPGRRLSDLALYRGEVGADASMRSGEIWREAMGNIGQTIAGGVQQHAEQARIGKRDAAWLGFINEGKWASDPKLAYTRSVEVWGPEEGPKQFQALAAVSQLTQQKRDPEKDQKALGLVGGAMSKMGDPARAQLWPQVRQLAKGVMPQVELPDEYDPTVWKEVVEPFVASMQPEKAPIKVGANETLLDPVTKQPIFEGKKEPKKYEVTVPGPGGRPVKKLVTEEELAAGVTEYREPKAAPRPDLERIETVGADGKPVTQFVEPRAGATYAKPTGAGKPATGQQRTALSYFNRGKEAEEIASSLEEGDKISPTTLKFMPEIGNVLLSDSNQAYKQAQRAFTEARLRKESGAAIPDSEYENDRVTYFAQPGDSDATKAQKRAGRRAVLAGIGFQAGDALREFYGDEAEDMLATYRTGGQAARPRAAGQAGGSSGAPTRVSSKADYDRLPSGAPYIAPDGTRRRKP